MTQYTIDDLLAIMGRLRDREHGCPWDREQNFDTIAPYTIEEAYEVADAIDRRDYADLVDELGDLLFQVVFHAQMAQEDGRFDFHDVVNAVCDKMLRRHPHVFGDAEVEDAAAQTLAWEEHKAREREVSGDQSALAGVAAGLPEWMRALKLQKRAARVGFDWEHADQVLDKIDEEARELREARPMEREEEFGDLAFALLNYARLADIDFSRALRRANAKFERRFRAMETRAEASGGALAGMDIDAMEALWQAVKRGES